MSVNMKTKCTQDFKSLALKFAEDPPCYTHTIYIKEHSVREHTKDKPSGRTLFVINVPPYVDEQGIVAAFGEAGRVVSVEFSSKPNEIKSSGSHTFLPEPERLAFRIAYIVFQKVSHLDKALSLCELRPINFNTLIKHGISKWIDHHNTSIIPAKVLKDRIEVFMKRHDESIKKNEEKEKNLEQEDDEGWVTVTKRGKVQSFARTDKIENKIMAKEEKNKKRKELKNFYTFQIRESKMKHIVTLRQKFEEDKKKIAQIKQSRRFKPF